MEQLGMFTDEEMGLEPIKVTAEYVGFAAVRGDYDLGSKVGWGRTPAEAIAALRDQEDW